MKKFPQQHQGEEVTRSTRKQKQKSVWIAGATVVVGAGTAISGAASQRVATNKTLDANRKQFDDTQLGNWNNYLLQRGINPNNNTQLGGFGSNPEVVNTKLPIWASVSTGQRRLVPAGSATPAGKLVVSVPSS